MKTCHWPDCTCNTNAATTVCQREAEEDHNEGDMSGWGFVFACAVLTFVGIAWAMFEGWL